MLNYSCHSDASGAIIAGILGGLGCISLGPKPDFHFGKTVSQLALSMCLLNRAEALNADMLDQQLVLVNTSLAPMLEPAGLVDDLKVSLIRPTPKE